MSIFIRNSDAGYGMQSHFAKRDATRLASKGGELWDSKRNPLAPNGL